MTLKQTIMWLEWALKNWCFWTVVLEKTLESPLDSKEIQPLYPKGNKYWIIIGRTDVEAETPIIWAPDMKSWGGKRLKMGGEGDARGWDGWMASLTQWTWVWVNSGSWWWSGRPDMLQSMGSQRVRHNWATELNWTDGIKVLSINNYSDVNGLNSPVHSKDTCVCMYVCTHIHNEILLIHKKQWKFAICSNVDELGGHYTKFCFIDCAKAFDCVDHNKLWKMKSSRDGNTRPPDLPLEKPISRSGSNS